MTIKTDNRFEYLLLTRIKRGDDLTQVGSFKADNDDIAKVYAQHIYDEEDWVEMYVIKKDNLVCVRKPEPLFAKG